MFDLLFLPLRLFGYSSCWNRLSIDCITSAYMCAINPKCSFFFRQFWPPMSSTSTLCFCFCLVLVLLLSPLYVYDELYWHRASKLVLNTSCTLRTWLITSSYSLISSCTKFIFLYFIPFIIRLVWLLMVDWVFDLRLRVSYLRLLSCRIGDEYSLLKGMNTSDCWAGIYIICISSKGYGENKC